MAKARLVTGLFKSKVGAEAAVDAIMKNGFSRDDISVMMSDATRNNASKSSGRRGRSSRRSPTRSGCGSKGTGLD